MATSGDIFTKKLVEGPSAPCLIKTTADSRTATAVPTARPLSTRTAHGSRLRPLSIHLTTSRIGAHRTSHGCPPQYRTATNHHCDKLVLRVGSTASTATRVGSTATNHHRSTARRTALRFGSAVSRRTGSIRFLRKRRSGKRRKRELGAGVLKEMLEDGSKVSQVHPMMWTIQGTLFLMFKPGFETKSLLRRIDGAIHVRSIVDPTFDSLMGL
ncbi:hypothetical protein RJ640_015105 [Escallonia rubra]|uniref:Uncharacterized protein ycf68 n=1 Tax=Escallonia rubra TaxID=112253 RepID=A0AA88U766_9ASTE|nr:hypothetical protein RJ640_015105 [Escallonia rubra]